MKWAVIGIIAIVLLGGIGFVVYQLTDWPEQGQEWWDEKRLENFPAIAEREIKEMEGRLEKLKETRKDLDLQRLKLEGGEAMKESNYSTADTGFLTKWGYEKKIAAYTEAGTALGNAYKDAAAAPGAVVSGDTGELDGKAKVVVSFVNPLNNRKVNNEEYTAADVLNMLAEIDETLTQYEYELPLVVEAIGSYTEIIKDVDETIKAQEAALKEFRQEVKKIEAQLKIIKVKEDLNEINAAINGKESSSELGKLIGQYEKKKKDFSAREMQAQEKGSKPKGLADAGKGSPTSSKGSRFLK